MVHHSVSTKTHDIKTLRSGDCTSDLFPVSRPVVLPQDGRLGKDGVIDGLQMFVLTDRNLVSL